MFKYFLLKNVV